MLDDMNGGPATASNAAGRVMVCCGWSPYPMMYGTSAATRKIVYPSSVGLTQNPKAELVPIALVSGRAPRLNWCGYERRYRSRGEGE
jgi:hypothetical protein